MSAITGLLPIGSSAPDFTAMANDGKSVTLSELCRAKRVVLVFYPGDDTAICTKQLCAFRDATPDLSALECTVLGINPAGVAKHSAFSGKYSFPFSLIADAGGSIAALYGCRAIFGIIRRTVYIIDRDRTVLYSKRGNPPVSELLAVVN